MKGVATWIQTKTVTILALVDLVANGGALWGWWTWTPEQTSWVNIVAGLVMVLFGAQTVTANKRLTGKWLGPINGVRLADQTPEEE
jgi:threonine/homoserine/homoserine lactone efflux protein